MNHPSVSDRIVNFLVESGITVFFGIPGGPVSPIFDSVLRHPKAKLIESRHETAAAFSAATYYEETGNTAALVVTAGPGGTNAVTGVASAFLKKIPLVIICGDVAWAEKGERLVQDCGPDGINMESIYSSITRKTIRIHQSQSVGAQFARAVEISSALPSPGPVLVMLPIQLATQASSENIPAITTLQRSGERYTESLSIIRKLLEDATKPLVVVGNGCRRFSRELTQLIELAGIPFVTTPQAKGIVSEDHALSLRNGGLAASGWIRKYVNEGTEVDVCLALGTDLDDCATGPTKYVKATTKLIHVDIDPVVFNRNYPTFLPLQAELASFIEQFIQLLKTQPIRNVSVKSILAEIKSRPPFENSNYHTDPATIIAPHRALADIQAVMPANTRYITDIGEHMLFALHYLTIKGTGAFYIHLNLGSMGSGIAGAIGLAIGDSTKPVVCICGDGCMQMLGMEILVAKKLNLPVIFAVFNDARYNMVFHGFKTLYGYPHAWDTQPIDFTQWAESMDIKAYTIKHPGDLSKEMITHSLQQSEPLVLDIHIDKEVRISGAGRNEHLQHMSASKNQLKSEVYL